MWVVTVLSLIGVVLNVKRKRICFAVWACTNAAWMVYDWHIGAREQAALFAVYLVLAFWGLWDWRQKPGASG